LIIPTFSREWIILISNFLEIYRRAQWCIIRLENEQIFNIEGYRNYLPVPQMPHH